MPSRQRTRLRPRRTCVAGAAEAGERFETGKIGREQALELVLGIQTRLSDRSLSMSIGLVR